MSTEIDNDLNKIVNPYSIKEMTLRVVLHEYQEGPNLMTHLFTNAKWMYENKCYKENGVITEIKNISDEKKMSLGLKSRDLGGTHTMFRVTFECQICSVIEKTRIVGKIKKIQEMNVTIESGPILISVYVNNDRINEEAFFVDKINSVRYYNKIDSGVNKNVRNSSVLKIGDFVVVKILKCKYINGSDKIVCSGKLDNMATENEVSKYTNVKQRFPDDE